MHSTDDLIEVYSPQDASEVMLLRQLLADEGVEAFIVNDGMEGVMGEVPFSYARPRIWVKSSDAAAARRICEAFDQRLVERAHGAEVDQVPFCYHCGETVTEQTQRCPDCGALI